MSRVSEEILRAFASMDDDSDEERFESIMARELRVARKVVETARAKRANPDSIWEEHAFDQALAAYDALEDGE